MGDRGQSGTTSVEMVSGALRAAIVRGDYPPDATLRLSELAARFGVSPIPIREALRLMQAEGFVASTPHESARVTPMTLADLHEIYAIRRLLEAEAVRRALPRLDAIALRRFERLAHDCDRAGESDLNAVLAADRAFHHLVWQTGNSLRLLSLAENLWDHGERYRRHAASARPFPSAGHSPLLAAFKGHDIDRATIAIHAHLDDELAAVELGFLTASPAGPSRDRIALFPAPRQRGGVPGTEH